MTRIRAFLIISILLLLSAAVTTSAIEISEVVIYYNGDTLVPQCITAGDLIEVSVTIKGADDSAYVGATVIDAEGDEINMQITPVKVGTDTLGKAEYQLSQVSAVITPEMASEDTTDANYGMRMVLRLWDIKVEARDCERLGVDGEAPCDWCRTMSYHMEDPVGLAITRRLPPYCTQEVIDEPDDQP